MDEADGGEINFSEAGKEKVILDDIGTSPGITYNGNYDIQVVGMNENDIINISQSRSISPQMCQEPEKKEEEMETKEKSVRSKEGSQGSKRLEKLQKVQKQCEVSLVEDEVPPNEKAVRVKIPNEIL